MVWGGVRAAILLAAAMGTLALAPAAAPRDSDAPPGAGQKWLPCERWVMFHWLPFDEAFLYRTLHTTRREVHAWLKDDRRHTLGQLANRRGITAKALAA